VRVQLEVKTNRDIRTSWILNMILKLLAYWLL
jgi:hypothetical protein